MAMGHHGNATAGGGKSTSFVCTCACVCVTIDTHTFGVDSQVLVWHIGTTIAAIYALC